MGCKDKVWGTGDGEVTDRVNCRWNNVKIQVAPRESCVRHLDAQGVQRCAEDGEG